MEQSETERYDPEAIEAKWQAVWARRGRVHGPEPRPSARRAATARPTSSRCSRTRRASSTWGTSSTTRSATSSRTSGAGRAYTVLRPMGYDAFGLHAENAAIREGGHPREITDRNIEAIRAPDEAHGLGDRLVARGLDRRARVLPLDAVALPAVLRARARLPTRGAGQLVPEGPDRARERAGDRRPLRALRHRGRGAEPRRSGSSGSPTTPTSCSTRWTLLESWPERVLTMQRNWIGRSEGARVDVHGRRERARSCRSSRRGPTRCSARRSSCSRPSTR